MADLVVLAGFMTILDGIVTKAYPYKIINVHPALIPAFCGVGYYGLKVHEAVLDYGVKITGATVHFVNEEADAGAIILQGTVSVEADDTPEILQNVLWNRLSGSYCGSGIAVLWTELKYEMGSICY
jgi:phosphoribosylglycinamide formyltransferase-1